MVVQLKEQLVRNIKDIPANTDRFKYRVWNTLTCTYTEGGCVKDGQMCFISAEGKGEDLELHIVPGEHQEIYVIEQCTGLKDCEGYLIYEGDYLMNDNGETYQVFWYEGTGGFVLIKDETVGPAPKPLLNGSEYYVSGNIHKGVKLNPFWCDKNHSSMIG